ncbi:MAG TPA: helix-turn-helix domain-containing protein [Trebonia sp.]|nr:helix-turn-helix domain-containing protein [Trebonia sp.]
MSRSQSNIAATAIDTIAEKLGISRGLISYHFAGKDDLMRQVVNEAAE